MNTTDSGTLPPKAARAQQIAKCVEIVSKHFETDPIRVMTSFNRNAPSVTNARNLLWFHLHSCGLSFFAIGRIWGLSETHVAKSARQGMIRLMPEDQAVLDTLPRIDNTHQASTKNSMEDGDRTQRTPPPTDKKDQSPGLNACG